MCKIAIIGLGNVMLGDDGLGVHVVNFLRRKYGDKIPDNVTILDVGTSIVNFIDDVKHYDYVIFIDAIDLGGKPGQHYSLEINVENKTSENSHYSGMDLHSIGLNEALELLMTGDSRVKKVFVIGCQPSVIDLSLELSAEVKNCMEHVIDEVIKLIEKLKGKCV